MFTPHGHHIPGTIDTGRRPTTVARCGGFVLCKKCIAFRSDYWTDWLNSGLKEKEEPVAETMMEKATRIVETYIQEQLDGSDPLPVFDVYIVWFSKVLQNWKALVSTTYPDLYYEVTYDGTKGVTYLDAYVKLSNRVIPD